MKALLLRQDEAGKTLAAVEHLQEVDFPQNEVTVMVSHSAVNYKDALAVTGAGKIVRSFPFVPGVDLCGQVLASTNSAVKEGDVVLATGWGIGEKYWGGYAQCARLKAQYITPLPPSMDPLGAMTIGTAGLTAMLCIDALKDIEPTAGPIVVSGASGGVGSFAVKLLARKGYEVVGVTSAAGKEWVLSLGAKETIMREDFAQETRALEKQKWAGAVDAVGGKILARILAELNYGGVAASCGLAGGHSLSTTVMPFILRGVRLIGIDSVYVPAKRRSSLWNEMASLLDRDFLRTMAKVVGLEQVPDYCRQILKGQTRGRIVVDINDENAA